MAEPDPVPPDSRRTLVVLVALTVVALLLVGAGAFLGVRVTRADVQDGRRAALLQAARDAAEDLTTIDYRTAKRDVQRLLDRSTSGFADDFGISSDDFTRVVVQTRLVSTGEVASAGIVQDDEDRGRVLVAVDATVRDAEIPEGTPRSYRLGMDLVLRDDRWLIERVEFIL